jgi:hypothetical protein
MNAYFWVMGRQRVIKPIAFITKQRKYVIFKRNVTFNEVIMVLKEKKPILDASVYDPIKGQNECFMPLDFKVDEHVPVPHVIPIPPIVRSPRVLSPPNLTPTFVPSRPPCLPMKFIIIEILLIPSFKTQIIYQIYRQLPKQSTIISTCKTIHLTS